MNRDKWRNRPPHLVSFFRGLYTRVAQKLGVHPSYVSPVARGERKSDAVKEAVSTETWKIIQCAANGAGNHFHGTSRAAATKRKATKEAANLTLASIQKEMAQPRFAKSARKEETNHHVRKLAKKASPKSKVQPATDSQPSLAGEIADVLEY